ncbi:MAG TPA: M90 family metallopeptidase [Casimicrobiaceae bacterium]|nr:M90 family metallopeptidase [Casimicrobiaceae bacterium]
MLQALREWHRRRVLTRSAIPDSLWNEALATLPFMARYSADDLARLRDIVVLFLDAKGILGARGHDVTPLQRVVIAIQACVLVLNLDLTYYDGFENIVVYPGEFVPGWEWEDEAGVVHRHQEPLAGEAMPRGPVVLSWPDVEAASDWETAGMNLVIHEFAHKLDMKDGDANGCPPLPPHIDAAQWKRVFSEAFEDFSSRVDKEEPTDIDPYASENPGEFFAVVSEVFFADPLVLRDAYPAVYGHLAAFYRQDPAKGSAATSC